MKSVKTNSKLSPAVIIGSGVAGLASACRLANKGLAVKVYESSSTYGGKLGEWKTAGFRFDKGPSLFTLPDVLDELFEDCGKDPRKYFQYQQLPLVSKYYYPDGVEINAYADLAKFKTELVHKLGEDGQKLNKFFKNIEEVYDFIYPIFLENPIREFRKHLKGTLWDTLKILLKMEGHRSLNSSNNEWFQHDKTVQLFNRFATYNGSNPYKAPATLNVIPHLEHNLGAFYVKGGMRQVAEALYRLALDLGVQFEFNAKVERILVENKRASGVLVNGSVIKASHVFCNMDVNKAYPLLLTQEKQPKLMLSQEKSTSALVFYWGMDIEDSPLDVHNILFSSDYKREFLHLSKGGIDEDPTIYVYISSKVDGQDAPAGKENWFVMINAPFNQGQDWTALTLKAKAQIIAKLNKQLDMDIAKKILVEEVIDPISIERETSSAGGALYGNSSNSMFAAFLRHPHKNKQLEDLYFVGGSVHPGGGIPLCLLSAKIATNEI